MKEQIKPEILRLREKESYERLGVFLNAPPNIRKVFAKRECLMLLNRLVGDQNYDSNFKTVWFVISQYVDHHWMNFSTDLWFFWQRRIMRRSCDEVEKLIERG